MTFPTRDVAIAWCAPAAVSSYFLESVVDLYEDVRTRQRIAAHKTHRTGPELAKARTVIVEWFLELNVPWLLMVDTDQAFEPRQFLDLLAVADPDRAPIVGGLIVGVETYRDGTANFQLEAGHFRDDGWERLLSQIPPSSPPLLRVDLVGAGFMVVHRRVFETMRAARPGHRLPWFEEAVYRDALLGEDYEFCRRAGECGVPVHVATNVHIGHARSCVIWPEGAAHALQAKRA